MIGKTNSKIGGDKVNGVIKEYVVETGETIAKGDLVKYIGENENLDSVVSSSPYYKITNKRLLATVAPVVFNYTYTSADGRLWGIRTTTNNSFYVYEITLSDTDVTYTLSQTITYTPYSNNYSLTMIPEHTFKVLNNDRIFYKYLSSSGTYGIVISYSNGTFTLSTPTLLSSDTSGKIMYISNTIYDNIFLLHYVNQSTKWAIKIEGTTISVGSYYYSYNIVGTFVDTTTNKTFFYYNSGGSPLYIREITIDESTLAITDGSTYQSLTTSNFPTYVSNQIMAIYNSLGFDIIKCNNGVFTKIKTNTTGGYIPADSLTYVSSSNELVMYGGQKSKNNSVWGAINTRTTYDNLFLTQATLTYNGLVFNSEYLKINTTSTNTIAYTSFPLFTGNNQILLPINNQKTMLIQLERDFDGIAKTGGTAGETIKVFMPE